MESAIDVRRLSVLVLAVALSLAGCRAWQDGKDEVSPGEEVESTTEDSAPKVQPPIAEAAGGAEAPAEQEPEPEHVSPGVPQRQTPPPPPPAVVLEEPARPEPTLAPVQEPVPTAPIPPAPAPPVPEIIEVTVPEGTVLELELLTPLDTSVSRVGDEIEARTISPVYLKGEPVLPSGTYVEGRVTEVQPSGRVKGRAQLAFTFDRLSTRSGLKNIRTSYISEEAKSQTKKDVGVIGGAAGIGALVGGIIGGKKGAAIGATIGGAGGTGVVLSTKGEEIRLPVGTQVNVRLDDPVVLQLN